MSDTDPLSKLQELLGRASLADVHDGRPPAPVTAPNTTSQEYHPDSDSDDEDTMNRLGRPYIKEYLPPTHCDRSEAADPVENTVEGNHAQWATDKGWQVGQPAGDTDVFIPWNTVKKYPYTYIGKTNREKVDKKFFAAGKLNNRTWHFFYIRRLEPELRPILLVPANQFQDFLTKINEKLNLQLTIPNIGPNGSFQVTFEDKDMPRPRYLGQATSKEMADSLLEKELPSGYIPKWEELSTVAPTDRSMEAFKAKMDMIQLAQKGKKLASKERAKTERVAKQQSWNHAIKRVQRYLGIRDVRRGYRDAVRKRLGAEGLEWAALDDAVEAELVNLPPSAFFDPEKPCIFPPEGSVVFVCVDVEAWERDQQVITEIGISTLDTAEIKDMIPGEGGTKWMEKIRARHFRIIENQRYENHEFVHGCADRFEFGESEWINLKDAPSVVASCFKPPYSLFKDPINPTVRDLVLVGHDIDADILYLKKMGYNVLNLGNLKEKQDTASMYRYLRRESNPRNLGAVLADLGITGWNLHNAGNDAVYTLQAMIGIAIRHLVEKQAKLASKEEDLQAKIQASIEEAKERVLEQNEGWSSAGEDSDGGVAVPPTLPNRASKSTYNRNNNHLPGLSIPGSSSASKKRNGPKDEGIVYW
ncbi:hypothetical protein BP6252_07785 [Coleophoma cylindrospora]|uniref:Gfd2/YDR514C-like C-terminal domain-containing protein n=1 Tax=Coleophoma cylindrospora TaxID=1849047 RepID=A0A3D8RB04_9HELO|nr:hypothetical protein BP6252_07785 [Coleophoma cylindrospora]